MILYLDTSCLVKLYVTEDHSSDAREWFEQSEATATSVVAFVEAAAAVTRRAREGHLRPDHASEALSRLAADWPAFVRVPVNEVAGAEVAQRHGLRALDAIHLAAAITLANAVPEVAVTFASFDARQSAAAAAEGLLTPG